MRKSTPFKTLLKTLLKSFDASKFFESFKFFIHCFSININYGNLEALKWLALVLMTGDHINHIIFKETMPILSYFGRLVLPLFAFCLAYPLAQPQALEKGIYKRVSIRLLLTGIISCIPYIAVRQLHHWYDPLNILFTLLLGTIITEIILSAIQNYKNENENIGFFLILLAFILFFIAGRFVEYAWAGLFVFICSWFYCLKPNNIQRFILWILSICSLYQFNGDNFYALGAIPIIYLFTYFKISLPRIKYIFYIYYPLHLSLIYLYSNPNISNIPNIFK